MVIALVVTVSLDRHAFRKISRSIHVATSKHGNLISEELQGYRSDQWLQIFFDVRHVDHVIGQLSNLIIALAAIAITGPRRDLTSWRLLMIFG